MALGIIADDFTGAVMVAGMLETLAIHCPVAFDARGLRDRETAPVVVAAARSRTVAVGEAISEVTRLCAALAAAGCGRLAYKACASFDSTPEGNIGPAADVLAEQSGRRPVLMSAGFPRFGSTVHQGYLFYRGRLVSESIKRFDPLTPMGDPDLVRFLGRQTPHPVALLPHAILRQGADPASRELQRLADAGAGHVLFDTCDDDDVRVTAEVAARRALPVAASDPLIVELARRLAAGSAPPAAPRLPAAGTTAVIAGSTGPVVMAQLAAFAAQHPVLTIDLLDARTIPAQIAAAVDWASRQAGTFAISTACEHEGVLRSQASLGPIEAARRAETILAGVAASLRDRGLRRFVVAGGETSGAVVKAMAATRARALPEGPLGVGHCVTAGPDPLLLYLKPGKLGADDVLLRATES